MPGTVLSVRIIADHRSCSIGGGVAWGPTVLGKANLGSKVPQVSPGF